ncbi:hypothetical protein [Nocardia sp. NPDC020380]|uniref:hypothetical protein n=1 Tax=Nocardia sp. NPDC020380 TaxID=3364309 RepID=UPI0037B1DF36
MMLLPVLANVAVALVSGVSCAVGLVRPRLALPAGEMPTPGTEFLLGAYAARALPLSLVTLAVLVTGNPAAIIPVLAVAGLAQLGDAALGARQRNMPMAATCVALAAVHLATATWLLAR